MTQHHRIVRSVFDGSNYSRPWSHIPPTVTVFCKGHGQGPDAFICNTCATTLTQQLADIPALLTDLEDAQTRQTRWVETGNSIDDDPEESPLPYDPRASNAIADLAAAVGSPDSSFAAITAHAATWTARMPAMRTQVDVARFAVRIAEAVAQAHQVLERPPEDCYYGECPQCHSDIYDERNIDTVTCPNCTYIANFTDHQMSCLNAGDNRWLTITELVGAITRAGEQVTRKQIHGWIERDGLTREKVSRPVWRDGQLCENIVYVYRLGEVRNRALLGDKRRAS